MTGNYIICCGMVWLLNVNYYYYYHYLSRKSVHYLLLAVYKSISISNQVAEAVT